MRPSPYSVTAREELMRVTTTLAGVAVAALTGTALYGPTQQPADAAPQSGHVEYRGELYPNPETGCIEIPDEPGATPRLWPDHENRDGDHDVLPSGEATDAPEGLRLRGDEVRIWPGPEFDAHAQPWPLCDDPEVSVVITDDAVTVIEGPAEPRD
jgi:hypothetical protein